MTTSLSKALSAADSSVSEALERLFKFIEFESVSSEAEHSDDMHRAAQWLSLWLTEVGFNSRVVETARHPIVYAEAPESQSESEFVTCLFYGHYDVQPVDPIDEWIRPPFNAWIADEGDQSFVFGRGSSDDKGPVVTFIAACKAFREATGKLPRVKIIIEGEEEIGDSNITQFISSRAEELKCDVAVVGDTLMWSDETPAITVCTRGLLEEEVEVSTSPTDIHSGLFGNLAANPIHILGKIITEIRSADGSFNVDGLNDWDEQLDSVYAQAWNRLGFDKLEYLKSVGAAPMENDGNASVLRSLFVLPSVDVNGIWAGYSGPGSKTIIPKRATMKLAFRLAPGQDAKAIRAAFRRYVKSKLPEGAEVRFRENYGEACSGFLVDPSSHYLQIVSSALSAEWGTEPALIGLGGSLPIPAVIADCLGISTMMVGFASRSDRQHGPNERFSVRSFEKAIRSWVHILDRFSKLPSHRNACELWG